ncbi:glycoside hydrolase [Aspergillus pseudoustus]|uniref:chitinase n=1 Tax=Aspergillus pseudoustus TaxID=1810923 RepID=A0ABR4K664_9EURO
MRFANTAICAIFVASSLLIDGSLARRNNIKPCPNVCSTSNAPGLWRDYHRVSDLARCGEPMLLDFALNTSLSNARAQKTIFACTQNASVPETSASEACLASVQDKTISLELGSWGTADASVDTTALAACEKTHIFGYSGINVVGIYIGSNVQRADAARAVAQQVLSHVENNGIATQMIAQYCGSTAADSIGLAINTEGNLADIQNVVSTWANTGCFTDRGESSTDLPSMTLSVAAAVAADDAARLRTRHLSARADECDVVQVQSGDLCDAVAARCGITLAELEEYNDASSTWCNNLAVGQWVCCSTGDLPDFSPQPNDNGTCYTYYVQTDDGCSDLAAANFITQADIEDFNSQTWGWMGCGDLQAYQAICLSDGTPPFPAPLDNAVCGPQVPGTTQPNTTVVADWAKLNACPLNACCDIWGQCGITPEFCTETESPTGNPGTAAVDTNGCISNCGIEITNNDEGPDEFGQVVYYLGSNVEDRECLTLEAWQISQGSITHLQFGFGTINDDWSITVDKGSDQFDYFKSMTGVKKIISFGGWDFSTSPETYHIFREGVKEENRLTLAMNIAQFVRNNGLDGVDFDWEYPGEPDIEGIPAGSEDEGDDYVQFLKLVRLVLDVDDSLSIAAPASFWYLQSFPIDEIAELVDYIVFMTYDLHGQWDYGKPDASPGCATGNCLWSHVNSTETKYALSMITKAGVPTKQLMIGVSSYGRSFEMTDGSCTGPDCTYTANGAKKGDCTDTSGYLANAEINNIIASDDTAVTGYDEDSDSDWMVYDGNQWVAYMTDDTKSKRTSMYKGWNLGGTTDWSIDLQKFVLGADAGGVFIGNATITPDACAAIDGDEVKASRDRQVAQWLQSAWANLKGNVVEWEQGVFQDKQGHTCSNPGSDICTFPTDCDDADVKPQWWAQFVIANFHQITTLLRDLLDKEVQTTFYDIDDIADDFPVQDVDTPDMESILSNVGAALGLVAGRAGEAAESTLSTASGILSMIASNIGDDEDDQPTVSDVLKKRLQIVLQTGYDGANNALIQMFEHGDVSNWTFIDENYDWSVANFFDGRFMTQLSGSEVQALQTNMNTHMKQAMAATAMRAANWYILKGSHSVDDCTDSNSGMVINDTCYTVESAGGGYNEKTWSVPIDDDTLEQVTDKYSIALADLYEISWRCQVDTDGYGGTQGFSLLASEDSLPSCFYNLPVFIVEESDDSSVLSSPCNMWAYNYTASDDETPQVGITYLPDNLVSVFDGSYCQCSPPTSSYCNIG